MENTLAIPDEVLNKYTAGTLDILSSNGWWSAGRLPLPGDSLTIARAGSTLPHVRLDQDLYISNLTVTASDFYLYGTGALVLSSRPGGTVSGSGMLKIQGALRATVPVTWNAGYGIRINGADASARFAEALTLTGTLEVSGGTFETQTLAGYFSYPSENSKAYLSLWSGSTGVATNMSAFGGSVHMQKSTLRTFGGMDALAQSDATPALVTEGLVAQFDASDLASFTFTNGNRIAAWRDRIGGLEAVPLIDGVFPWYVPQALGTNAIVDFGPSAASLLGGSKFYAAPLKFATPLSSACTVFYFMDTQPGGGWLLPATSEGTRNFYRGKVNSGYYGVDLLGPWANGSVNPNVTFRSNGTVCDMFTTHPIGTYEILTLANPTVFTHPIAGLAFDNLVQSVEKSFERNGSQRIGEFLAYGRTLSEAEIRQVEAYLYRKWLNGRGYLRQVSYKQSATLDIGEPFGAGYEVHVQNVNGRGRLIKQGKGTLVVDRPREVPDTIHVREGTVAFENTDAKTPVTDETASYPTDGLVLHLDATEVSSITTNDLGDVVEWRTVDGAENALVEGVDGTIRGVNPFRRPNAFNGKPMVDFGMLAFKSFMNLSNRITTARTVMMAFDGRMGGGHLLTDTNAGGQTSYHRGECPDSIFAGYDIGTAISTQGGHEIFVNGLPANPYREPMRCVPEILTFTGRSGNKTIGRIGMDRANTDRSGGIALGELLVWNRTLDEGELARAYKYLKARWIDETSPAVRSLRAEDDGAVAARPAVTVGTLSGDGRLAAKDGTVTVRGLADFSGALASEGGTWDIRHENGAVASANPVTAGLLAHFDPSAADTVTTNGTAGITAIRAVNDATLVAAPRNAAYCPTLRAANATMNNIRYRSCGTNAIVDCGTYVANATCRGLQFSRAFTNVHTVIVLVSGHYPTPGLFGSTLQSDTFPHASDSRLCNAVLLNGAGKKVTDFCETWVNGCLYGMGYDTYGRDDYQILSFVWPHRVSLDQLGYVKTDGSSGGGMVYGEFLMWDRCLSDDERKSVEAYLAAKWFSKAWHGYAVAGVPDIPGYETAGAPAVLQVAAGTTNGIGYLSGDAGLVKTGEGALELCGSTAELTGDLDVRAGTVRYTTAKTDPTVLPLTEGLLAHFDAEKGVQTNASGVVTNWQAQAGLAPYGSYRTKRACTTVNWPKWVADGPNGHGWIDFGPFSKGSGLKFDAENCPEEALFELSGNTYVTIPNCKTVVLMFNSARGGGFLLGNLGDSYYHRDGSTPSGGSWCADYAAPLVNTSSLNNGFQSLYADTVAHAALDKYVFNAGWQVVEISKTSYNRVAGFAFDRAAGGTRSGGQGLAEAIFYDHVLDDAERTAVRAYLYRKYRNAAAPGAGTQATMYANAPHVKTLAVASGAAFDLNGYTQTVDTLACSGGTVSGGTLVVTNALAFVPGESLTVSGTVRFGDDLSVVVPEGWKLAGGTYRLLTATSLENVAALRAVRMQLEKDGKTLKARFEVNGNAVDLVVYKMGTVLLLR